MKAANRPTGSKRERSPGTWQLIVYAGRDPLTNKHRYRYKTFHGGSRAAGTELSAFITECAGKKPSSKQTVGWAVEEWLELQTTRKRAESTLLTYRNYFDNWIKDGIGKKRLDQLTAGDIEDLHAQMIGAGKSLSTVRQVHAILRGSLGYAKRKRWVSENVVAEIPAPSLPPTVVVAATPEEIAALYIVSGSPGEDLPTAIALATHTGARLGELCALRWSDIENGMIHFIRTKTHQNGNVEVTTTLKARLLEREAFQLSRAAKVGVDLVDDPYVLSFSSTGSTKPGSSSYTHAFQRVRDLLGLGHLHFHTLRHAFVTQALAAGVDPLTVSKLVGHRDLTMIGRVYGHGTAEASSRAMKKIDRAFKPKALN